MPSKSVSEEKFRVSAIVSTYNSERFIRGRLNDLLCQTLAEQLEIVIINSGSSQGEDDIIRSEYLPQHPNIVYMRTEERETIYKAWNRGIRLSSGRYITNANTDDRLKKDGLEILANELDSHPSIGLVYADQLISQRENEEFERVSIKEKLIQTNYSRLKLLQGYIGGSQSMWRASIHFIDNIWFDELFEITGDYDFICRVAEHYDMYHLNMILGSYYRSPDKTNKEYQNVRQTINEAMSIQEKYARRYLQSLPENEQKRLLWKASMYSHVPRNLFSAVRLAGNTLFPAYRISPKLLWCWLGSLIAEQKGDIAMAKAFCHEKYRNIEGNLVHRQYHHLLNKGVSE
ncbi:MAG: glycosyltransferase [Bacteroidota bacterium]